MSRESALSIVGFFATLTLAAQIFIVVFSSLFFLYLMSKKNKTLKNIVQFFSVNALPLSFLVALVAMTGSLFFSEIAHFTPCKLCWYQRILMYPQVLILGIASLKNDFDVKKYILPLSVIGAVIAIYHYLLQMSPLPLPCSDEVANCALKQVGYYGYITIPLMSFTAFVLIIIFMLLIKKNK